MNNIKYGNRALRAILVLISCFLSITSCSNSDLSEKELEDSTTDLGQEPEIGEENVLLPLPIVSINTNGVQIVDEPKIDGNISIVVDEKIMLEGNIAIELRGSSSQDFPKKSYLFETRDASNQDLDVSFLDFPEEEDWILYGPYIDKTLLRNHLIYNLARDMGVYASRSRLVELNMNGSYAGLYVLMEKLKRDKNRIDISKLNPDEIMGDDLTGGYIIKIDKSLEGYTVSNSFESNASISGDKTKFLYEYPDPEDIVQEQRDYIKNYFLEFERVLASENFTDLEVGYEAYIDTDSFIDFFLLNEFSGNTDAFRISTFLHKDKGGKLTAGPIWDFNLSFGNGNSFDKWCYKFNEQNASATLKVPFWWKRLLQDPRYVSKLKNRWGILRSNLLSFSQLENRIDSYIEQMRSGKTIDKNFERWPILDVVVWPGLQPRTTYNEEIIHMINWIDQRLLWMDGEINSL
ncbi:hypothetical protein FGM00_13050 [Aggregatimonas sangjinii]|uniref:Spore coat protein CotH n=1 Tax=Aggregatimonas sangjinii TaxID=2583587 RepID=A0A5B7SV13_9FLAO|nr:CotH kinase family protein [Aggregatimonas sangjinii]QCX00993.1 hypothetical protein FGM00_13050 [Aggregatimonas sangjinii]